MNHKAALAAAILAVASSSATAQGVTGGELGITYNAPTNGSDFGGTTYTGGLEYGFLQTFSVSANAAGYKFDNIDTTSNNVTLHGTYHLSSTASVGGFYARDDLDGTTADIFGAEGGTEFMGGDVGGYLGRVDDGTDTGTLLGFDGSYALRNGFSVIGEADVYNVDGDTLSQVSIGAEYELAVGPEFYAHIGRVTGDIDGSSDSVGFFGIGAKVAFGATRGTTFSNRSVLDVLPGF
ncbi:hypothetical protein ACOI1H_18375 [Loktanella sp. DJP18]|uniref:hypothetical protein n=1 Tax=Loktanella sp. DJP18 TaxID=3409788 RepID=UPI003BB54A2D